MSAEKKYLRCACPACGHVITYPVYSAGGTSVCEKCKRTVKLPAAAPQASPPVPAPKTPGKEAQPQQRRGFLRFILWSLNFAVIAGVALVLINREKARETEATAESIPFRTMPSPPSAIQVSPQNTASVPETDTTNSAPPKSNSLPVVQTNVITLTNVVTITNVAPEPTNALPTSPPGTNSLAVLSLSIERPKGNKGSRLTYVTGVLQNQSDTKRFGVRIDLNLLDQARNQIAMATDYSPIIDPRGTWRFRALVLDSRTVGASVAGIREDQ
jgi:hypothetical protein